MIDITIIFVSYNTGAMTIKAIDLVKKSLPTLNLEIFVVDNASKDNSVDLISHNFPDVKLIANSTNVGFGRANNQVLSAFKGKYLLLLNTDAFVAPDTIQQTYEFMEGSPKTGVLGVKLVGRDNVLQPSCRYFPTPWNIFLFRTGLNKFFKNTKMIDNMAWPHDEVRQCDWVPGCYYLIRKEVIDEVGLFDPRFFLYYEEVDHCFSTKKAGWDVTYFPHTTVIHIGGESAKTDNSISTVSKQVSALQIESELLYFRKNLGLHHVFLHLMMITLVELLTNIKALFKTLFGTKQLISFKNLTLFWKLFIQTNAGSKSLH